MNILDYIRLTIILCCILIIVIYGIKLFIVGSKEIEVLKKKDNWIGFYYSKEYTNDYKIMKFIDFIFKITSFLFFLTFLNGKLFIIFFCMIFFYSITNKQYKEHIKDLYYHLYKDINNKGDDINGNKESTKSRKKSI